MTERQAIGVAPFGLLHKQQAIWGAAGLQLRLGSLVCSNNPAQVHVLSARVFGKYITNHQHVSVMPNMHHWLLDWHKTMWKSCTFWSGVYVLRGIT